MEEVRVVSLCEEQCCVGELCVLCVCTWECVFVSVSGCTVMKEN